ncbi:MAG: tripartite tricarboxylate transporter TctB family protein [Leptospiraceae bacterium]|nr:tripartite tricarboxylate transporter TctB family protein [Leptospiraceae bacterium]
MKCPNCSTKQKYKDGLTCQKCGYRNALNPKEPPNITDYFLKSIVTKISRDGKMYYTYEQLLIQFIKGYGKKFINGWIVFYIVSFVILLAVFINYFFWMLAIIFSLGVMIGFYFLFSFRKTKNYDYSLLNKTLKTYLNNYPDKNLADGNAFSNNIQKIEEELSNYAPESVLIVDKNDYTDMLLLNRYHIENKVLVLSKYQYPKYIFEYFQKLIQKHPSIPIKILHEASEDGDKMKENLLADTFWNLKDKEIHDLGLFWKDTKRLKRSFSLPKKTIGNITVGKNIPYQKDTRIPLGMIPPIVMGSVLIGTISSGEAMTLADSLEEHQKNSFSGSADFG